MNNYWPRDVVVEEVRYLVDCGYRGREREAIETGISKRWHRQTFWIVASKKPLSRVINILAAK